MSRVVFLAAALAVAGFSAPGQAADPARPAAPETDPPTPEPKKAQSETAPASAAAETEQEKLEKAFAEMMTGATLCGHFTAGSLSDVPCKDAPPDAGKPKHAPENAANGDKGPGDANKAPADAKPLKEDRYTLGRVKKLEGDNWLIEARIQYGGHDVNVPLILKVKWAGDTPVITLTDFNVPGLGVFTARVLFYRGQYAGAWRHGDHGGEMFGRVLPAEKSH